MDKKKMFRFATVVGITLIILFAITQLTDDSWGYCEVDTSVAPTQLDKGNVMGVQIDDHEQRIRLALKKDVEVEGTEDVTKVMTKHPARAIDQVSDKVATAKGMEKFDIKATQEPFLTSTLGFLLPMAIFFFVIMYFFSRMQGGKNGMFGFGGNRVELLNKETPINTFEDVAGADEVVQELDEIRGFLQHPARYEELGAKIPRGALLYGPPGTGRTLLVRTVASGAGVPFYITSGSDFVEMFVGVGTSRVRDLFSQTRENSLYIISIDEIDAAGRQRGAGMGGGRDEREQALNQLLVEMSGFGDRQGVIIMAATNRPDILDPVLLRPDRPDQQILVGAPGLKGREAVPKVHAWNKLLGPDVDLTSLAKRTVDMNGADLQNVLNEAALLTAHVNSNVITADVLEEAVDRVIGGPRRTSKVISEQEKKVTAYHEGGHTLAAWALKDIKRIYKVIILARDRTDGHMLTVPEDDKGMYNLLELFVCLVFAIGGRAAEELVFGLPMTDASADIEQATKITRVMVTKYGMLPELGPAKYGEEQGDPFVGRGGSGSLDYSLEVAATIDQQVRLLISKAHDETYVTLKENRDTLDVLAEKLLEKGTLCYPNLEVILTGIVPYECLNFFDGDTKHPANGHEPVKTSVELAIERGEEPSKRVNIFAPVCRRKPENQGVGNNGNGQGPAGSAGIGNASTPGLPGVRQDRPNVPAYGGIPPLVGWTAPGWPPKDTGSPHGSAPASAPAPISAPAPHLEGQSQSGSREGRGNGRGQHPGTASYPAGSPDFGSKATDTGGNGGNGPADTPAPPKMSWDRKSGRHRQDNSDSGATPTTVMPSAGQQQELREFRLPDNERSEYTERSENVKSADNFDDKGAQMHNSDKDGVVKRNDDNSAWQDKPDTNEE